MSYGTKKGGYGSKAKEPQITVPKPAPEEEEGETPAESSYTPPECKGTVIPNRLLPVDPELLDSDQKAKDQLENISMSLKKAFKGLGTNEARIISVLSGHTNVQRQAIKKAYITKHGEELEEQIRQELGGDFEELCLGLLMPPEDYQAFSLHQAVEGIGTCEKALIEILCTSSNQQMEDIKERYKSLYEKDLQEVIQDDTSGDFQKLMVSLLQGNREETSPDEVDKDKVQEDAKEIYQAGEGHNWGTDEGVFNRIMVSRSYPHLKEMFTAYQEKADGVDIEDSIQSEFTGHMQDALLALVKHVKDPYTFWASRLHDSLVEEIDTDEDTIMRIFINHCEVDMVNIMSNYRAEYGETLLQTCEKHLYGDFGKLMIRLLDPKPYK